MPDGLTVTRKIHFSMANKGKRQIKPGPAPVRDTPAGRVPRVSRLMALAIKFDNLLATGGVRQRLRLRLNLPRSTLSKRLASPLVLISRRMAA